MQQLLDAAEVVLAEGEQELDWQRLAQQADDHLGQRGASRVVVLKEREDLLKLIEDDQRLMLARRSAQTILELGDRQDDAGGVVV